MSSPILQCMIIYFINLLQSQNYISQNPIQTKKFDIQFRQFPKANKIKIQKLPMQLSSQQISLPQLLNHQYQHWYKNNRISTSISYLICKKLMIHAHFNFTSYLAIISIIDSFVQETRNLPSLALISEQWLNFIIFNTTILNNQYKQQLSHSLSSSSSDKHRSDISLQLIENLQQIWSKSMSYLINMQCIGNILKETQKRKMCNPVQHRNMHEVEYTLFNTINYLCNKNKINCKYSEKIKNIIASLTNCQCCCVDMQVEQPIIHSVNQMLFGNEKLTNSNPKFQLTKLQQILQKNDNISLLSIASLIDSNYYNYQISRPTFIGCLINGSQLMELIIRFMVGLYNKNQLFSQHMLDNQKLFQLFLTVVEFRYLDVYVKWLIIVEKYINNQNNKQLSTLVNNFLLNIPNEHRQFIQILKCIYSQLINSQHSKNATVDIIKKFLLNRFLLDPTLFYAYSELQIDEDNLSIILNKIKMMFYPKKAQTEGLLLQSKIIQTSLLDILSNPSSSNKQNQFPATSRQSKKMIYQSDRTLNKDYLIAYADLIQKDDDLLLQNPQYPVINVKKQSQDQSFSFSFIKNQCYCKNGIYQDFGYGEQITDRLQNQDIQSNIQLFQYNGSCNIVSDNTRSQGKKLTTILSPTSQKSKNSVLTQFTDNLDQMSREIAVVDELIYQRKLLIAAIKNIDERKLYKDKIRQQWLEYFDTVYTQFEKNRKQMHLISVNMRNQIYLS